MVKRKTDTKKAVYKIGRTLGKSVRHDINWVGKAVSTKKKKKK